MRRISTKLLITLGFLYLCLSLYLPFVCWPMGKKKESIPTIQPTIQLPFFKKPSFSALLIYQVLPQNKPEDVLTLLKKYPEYRITLILPKDFLSPELDPELVGQFRQLIDEGRIEPVLVLPNQVILPLIYDLNLAKGYLPEGYFLPNKAFAWPEDIRNQLAEAKADYFRLWGKNPQGLILPNGVFSEEIIPLLKKMDLQWGLGAYPTVPGQPNTNFILRKNFNYLGCIPNFYKNFDSALIEQLPQSVFITINIFFQDPKLLEQLDKQYTIYSFTPSQLVANFSSQFLKTEKENIPPLSWEGKSFSYWVGQGLQNRIWELLADARQAVETYKNSGYAEIDKLDTALDDIYSLESSSWFEETTLSDPEKELFLRSGLANIYRLIDQPIPAELNRPLKEQISALGSETKITVSSNSFLATDNAGDDQGDGNYIYPQDPTLVPGYFDLKSFQLIFNDKDITFKVEFSSANEHSRLLIDIYIDLNHTLGAGSTELLPGRNAETEPLDAWEYCLSFTNQQAELLQSRSFQKEPNLVATFYTYTNPLQPEYLTVTIPREILRGNPLNWGYSVCVLGALQATGKLELTTVKEQATFENFGGGTETAPPLIDLLVPPGYSQEVILGNYREKRVVEIPALRIKSGK